MPRQLLTRTRLANVLLLFTGILAALAFIELAVRVAVNAPVPQPPRQPLWQPHPTAIWAPIPGVETVDWVRQDNGDWTTFDIRISHQGYRGPDLAEKQPDEYRVLMLGDSFTFGWGIDQGDDFASQVQRALAESLDQPVSIINCSAIGYAPWQELARLKSDCLDHDPDVILLQLFPANDVHGSFTKLGRHLESWQVWEENLLFWKEHPKRAQFDRWLRARWKTWHLFWYAGQYNNALGAILGALPFNPPHDWPEQPREIRQPLLELNLNEWYPDLERAWSEFESDVLAIADFARERDIPLYIYAIPHPAVSEESWNRRMTRLATLGDVPDYIHHKDTRLTEAFLKENDLNYIPILDPMLQHSDPDDLYLKRDGHLNEAGGRFVAGLLAEDLKRQKSP